MSERCKQCERYEKSLKEIAFDKDRHYAVVSYSFWCGSLCGHGKTMVFEKPMEYGKTRIGFVAAGFPN
jgi:hypothetical protein